MERKVKNSPEKEKKKKCLQENWIDMFLYY